MSANTASTCSACGKGFEMTPEKQAEKIVGDWFLKSYARTYVTRLDANDLVGIIAPAIAAITQDRDHWKANHDNLVAINRALMDRLKLKDKASSDIEATGQNSTREIERLNIDLEWARRDVQDQIDRTDAAKKQVTQLEETLKLFADLARARAAMGGDQETKGVTND